MIRETNNIATYLLDDEFFENFKLRKKDSSIIKQNSSGFEKVELQNWIDTNHSVSEKGLVILPVYSKRFDILHKWFERFSFKTISDQRDTYSIGFEGQMLGKKMNTTSPFLKVFVLSGRFSEMMLLPMQTLYLISLQAWQTCMSIWFIP